MKRTEIPELQAGDVLVEREGYTHVIVENGELTVKHPIKNKSVPLMEYWGGGLTREDKAFDIVKIIRAKETIWSE
jgi:hypothetical protein